MKKLQFVEARNLLDAWVKACTFVHTFGKKRGEKFNQYTEVLNLPLTIHNSYELDHSLYFDYFGKELYNKVISIYKPGGSIQGQRNYAEKIYRYKGVDQVAAVVKILTDDPLSKSATIILADPKSDRYHFPCVMDINFKIREEKLIMTVLFKSSDVAKKFIPDMCALGDIHITIAKKLQIARGKIDIIIMSAQIHHADVKTVNRLLKEKHSISHFNEAKTIENWNKEASLWDKRIKDPHHYVNIENGYQRFLDFSAGVFKKNTNLVKGAALDSGCGTGVVAKLLNRYVSDVWGIDIADRMILEARRKVKNTKFILANCLDIPFADEFFNIIVSRGVLISHVGKKHYPKFLEEASRTLAKGGVFIFDFITHFQENETLKKRKKAVFTKKKISRLLESYGFKVTEFCGEDKHRVNAVFCVKK